MNSHFGFTTPIASECQRQIVAADWPVHGLEQLGKCPVCESPERVILHKDLTDRWFGAPGSWTLHGCKACGSGYLDPRPDEATIPLAYVNYFTHRDTLRKPLIPSGGTYVGALKRIVMKAYLNSRTSGAPFNLQRLSALALWLRPGFQGSVESLLRHLPPTHLGATLLDIGCGNGDFLHYASEAGWNASGMEFDEKAAMVAQRAGFKVYTESMEDLVRKGLQFDAVTLSHVIEHVHRPQQFLVAARRLLKPNGAIWIETPNIAARGHSYHGNKWSGLHPPHHLVIFSKQALVSQLRAAGFVNVRTAPWRPLWRTTALSSASSARELREVSKERYRILFVWQEFLALIHPSEREFITLVASNGTGSSDVPDRRHSQ